MNTSARHLQIVWLYHDLMNLYGDRGNILTLQYRAQLYGLAARVTGISLGEEIPADTDIVFFGGGQDQEQQVVSKDLPHKKAALQRIIEEGGGLLAVCGGYQLLGSYYQPLEGETIPGLGLLPIYTVAGSRRMIGDLVIEDENGNLVIGFENHSGKTYLEKNAGALGAKPLGTVQIGFGNNGEDKTEGIVVRNAIGTYLHGPALPKNPALTDQLLVAGLRRHGDTQPLGDLSSRGVRLEPQIETARTMALARAQNRKKASLGLRS